MDTKKRMSISKWSILVIQFLAIFANFDCMAQESLLLAATTLNTQGIAILNHTAPAGPKPNLNLSDCGQSNILTNGYENNTNVAGDDVQIVDKILGFASPDHGYRIFKLAPEEVMWWIRTFGVISVQSLGVAIHESNHMVDALLTKCNNGFATYFFNGRIIKTDHKFGDTPKYSIAAEMLPSKLKINHIGSRFSQYIEKNGLHAKSDFSVLLDEFVAYAGGAPIDLWTLQSKEYSWLLSREVTGLDVNVGGMADFMIYALSYLKELRTNYPEVYLKIQQQPRTLALLQTVWTAAEATLVSAFDLSQNSKKGGILIISRDTIATIYSDEFLGELDKLEITHMSVNSWFNSYLNSIK